MTWNTGKTGRKRAFVLARMEHILSRQQITLRTPDFDWALIIFPCLVWQERLSEKTKLFHKSHELHVFCLFQSSFRAVRLIFLPFGPILQFNRGEKKWIGGHEGNTNRNYQWWVQMPSICCWCCYELRGVSLPCSYSTTFESAAAAAPVWLLNLSRVPEVDRDHDGQAMITIYTC